MLHAFTLRPHKYSTVLSGLSLYMGNYNRRVRRTVCEFTFPVNTADLYGNINVNLLMLKLLQMVSRFGCVQRQKQDNLLMLSVGFFVINVASSCFFFMAFFIISFHFHSWIYWELCWLLEWFHCRFVNVSKVSYSSNIWSWGGGKYSDADNTPAE